MKRFARVMLIAVLGAAISAACRQSGNDRSKTHPNRLDPAPYRARIEASEGGYALPASGPIRKEREEIRADLFVPAEWFRRDGAAVADAQTPTAARLLPPRPGWNGEQNFVLAYQEVERAFNELRLVPPGVGDWATPFQYQWEGRFFAARGHLENARALLEETAVRLE